MENEALNTQESTETTDAFLDGWDNDAAVGETEQGGETKPNQSSEQQTEENAQAETPAAEQGSDGSQSKPETNGGAGGENAQQTQQQEATQPKADEPKMWTLRYMDADKQVSESEMITLAQKGMDYDRIRGKYDESKPVMELFGSFAKQAGMSISDYLSAIRTQAKRRRPSGRAAPIRRRRRKPRQTPAEVRTSQNFRNYSPMQQRTRRRSPRRYGPTFKAA